MSELLKAADDARRLLRGFKAFEEVAAALDAAGSLEQRTTELTTAVATLTAEHAALLERAHAAREVLATTQRENQALAASAQDAAALVVAHAQEQAANIVAEANAAAEAVKDTAAQAAAAVAAEIETSNETLARVTAEVEALEARAASAREYLAKLTQE